MSLTIELQGFEYVVSGEGGEELASFNQSRLGDQVARELAQAYKEGYEDGYARAEVDADNMHDRSEGKE